MISILDNKWYPVTSDFGVIRKPIKLVVREFERVLGQEGIKFSKRECQSISKSFLSLEPLRHDMRKKLFISLKNGWTAYFSNGIYGSDPFPVMSRLSRDLRTIGMRIHSSKDGNIWEVYDSTKKEADLVGFVRTIYACTADSGRWEFGQSGKPFKFENKDMYEKRRIKDRFDDNLFLEYLIKFEIRLSDSNFFVVNEKSPAILLIQRLPLWKKDPRYGKLKEFKFSDIR